MNKIIAAFTLAFLVAGIVHLDQKNPGSVELVWLGYKVTTSAIGLLSFIIFITLLFMLWGRFWAFLERIPRFFMRRGQRLDVQASEKLILLAMKAYSDGEYDRARKFAAQAYQKNPHNTLLAITASRCGAELPEVVENKLKSDKIIGPLLQRQLFRGAVKSGDLDNALAYSQTLLTHKSAQKEDLSQILDIMLQCKKYEKAEQIISEMQHLDKSKNTNLALMESAICCIKTKKHAKNEYSTSLRMYTKKLQDAPRLWFFILPLVGVYKEVGRFEKGIKFAIDYWLKTPRADVWLYLIKWQESLDFGEKELKNLKRVCEKQSDVFMKHFCLALLFYRTKSYIEAKTHLIKAKELVNCREISLLLAKIEEASDPNSKATHAFLSGAAQLPSLVQLGDSETAEYMAFVGKYKLENETIVPPQTTLWDLINA